MIEHALIISLMVLFLHFTSWKGHIFEGIQKIIKPSNYFSKPVYGCPVCQTPFYGTAFYFIFFNEGFRDWILTIGAACGIAVIYVVLLTVRTACVNYNKQFDK